MDFRFAIRSLLKNPGFAVLAVFVLALGMGANTAIFSVVNTLLLRPLPYAEPDRIVRLYTKWMTSGKHGQVSSPDFQDWKRDSASFSAVSYFQAGESTVVLNGAADYAPLTMVNTQFFDIFRVNPVAGRLFTADEEKRGGPAVMLASHSFAENRLGGAAQAIGKQIRYRDVAYTVVGVLPTGFHYPGKSELWFSAAQVEENIHRTGHNYRVVARLKDGVPLDQANSELKGIAARIEAEYPKENKGKSSEAVPLHEDLVGDMRRTLGLLFAAVTLVLVIACANVANLLLAKATARTREVAVRSALGASRWDIARLLLSECLVLAITAAFAGFLAAYWGVDILAASAPKDLPRLDEISVDWRVFVFSLVTSVFSTLLFGLAPAVSASKVDLNETLK